MARTRGKGPKGPSKGKRPKATGGDTPGGPPGPGPRAVVDAKAEQERLAAEFEARKRQQLAKAAIELDAKDAEILRLHVTYPALTQEQLGEFVGLGRQAVNERMNAAKFKRAIEIASRTAVEIFEGNKAAAARKLGALINSIDDRVALRAAVAHLWPMIHSQKEGSGDQFVQFIQEAFELAKAGEASSNSAAPAAAADAT
jgi:predicted DNA-binding protein (UPF0251 family)